MLPERDLDFVKKDPETPKTKLVIVVGLLLFSLIFDAQILAYAALGIGLIVLIIPFLGNVLVWAWYKLALILSKIVNPLILGILYITFITPIAILFRLFGNDPMRLKDNRGSMYETREHTYRAKDLKNPW